MTPRNAAVAALVAAIGLTTFAPVAFAAPPAGRPAERGMQDGNQGRPMQVHDLEFRNRAGDGRFSLVDLRCSTGAADRMDRRLDRIAERLELTEEQQALYETFRTSALSAQTAFTDSCATLRPANNGKPADPIAALELRLKIDEARVASFAAVLPDLRAFYDSLTDTQKSGFMPQRMARGEDGKGFAKPGSGRHEHRGAGGDGRPTKQGTPPAPPAAPADPTAPAEPAPPVGSSDQDG